MGEIRCKDPNGIFYLSPGKNIDSIPIFGGTSNSFTEGSPTMASITATYTYINKIIKGNNSNYYFSDISSGLIKNLYATKTIYIGGVATPLLYRRYTKLYYGVVGGATGSTGGSNSYMADERMGGGGGGGGGCLFHFTVASDTTPTFTKSSSSGTNTLTVTCDGYTISFTGNKGSNGGSGSGSCTGGGGSGGSGGGATLKLGDTSYSSQQFAGQYGPFYIVAYIQNGSKGGSGGTWGDYNNGASNSVTYNSTLKDALGISDNISWTNQYRRGGASIAPTITYLSGSSANGGADYWEVSYSLE